MTGRDGQPMRFVVLGGGCYGTFYARQLLRARAAAALEVDEIVVVDREERPRARLELEPGAGPLRFVRAEWDAFLADYLAALESDADDRLITPPFTPHLSVAWLLRRLRESFPTLHWTTEPFRRMPGTPFERQTEGGPLVVSHADWICPVHCIEPATCPATRGPRQWDLDRTVRHLAVALEDGGQAVDQLHLFHCHHIAYGVGGFPAVEIVRAYEAIAGLVGGASPPLRSRFLVGTLSHCHGALHLLTATAGTDRESVQGDPP